MLRVMTFNLRHAGAVEDGENGWAHRRDLVIDTIRGYGPDLLGTQECLAEQGDFLGERLPDYEMVGVCRDDGCRLGEAAAILFCRERFERLDAGDFWLSETPATIGSRGWDARLPRICSWVRLRERSSNRDILFLNTHFDHLGSAAQVASAKLIRDWLWSQPRRPPVIITGDFNIGPGSEPWNRLTDEQGLALVDAIESVRPQGPPLGTFHGFTGQDTGERIDWILCSQHFAVLSAAIVGTDREGRYPSDHFPVTADLRWRVSDG